MMIGIIMIVTRMQNPNFITPETKQTAMFFITFAIFPMAMEISLTMFLGEVDATLTKDRKDILVYALYALTAAFYTFTPLNFGKINNSVTNNI